MLPRSLPRHAASYARLARTGPETTERPWLKTIDDDAFECGYQAGAQAARAGMASDLRAVVDFITSELRALRIELCRATGQPMPEPLDQNGMNGRKGLQ